MFRTFATACAAATSLAQTYDIQILEKVAQPAISIKKPVGQGYSPCTYTFNPAWFPTSATLTQNILFVRASGCPAAYGGGNDHLLFAYCDVDGVCGDVQVITLALRSRLHCWFTSRDSPVQPLNFSAFPAGSEDPRVFYYQGNYYNYIYQPGPGQQTVALYKSPTPLVPSSWTLVKGQLPWHRNGCVILREDGKHYVIYGETSAIPGIGIASTYDFVTYNVINSTWMEPLGANNTNEPEIVLEAATAPVQLSTGDYLHLYAAGTPGWVANGNYTAGWVILDGTDPTIIKQRSSTHLFVASMDYEIGNGIWPVQRNRTIFTTSVVPIQGQVDTFRVWYGAADANVAWAIIQVTHT